MTDKPRSQESKGRVKNLHQLIEVINDAAFIHYLEEDGSPGRFIEVNSVACQRLGYVKEELLQLTPIEIGSKESRSNRNEILNELMDKGSSLFETVHVSKDGRQIPVESHINLFNHHGQQVVISISRDITHRKRSEKALRESEEKYRTLVEQSIEGIAIATGRSPKFIFANLSLSRMLGHTVNELMAMSPQEIYGLIHTDDREMFLERFKDRLAREQAPNKCECRAITKDKREIWLEISSTNISYMGKSAVQVVFTDITERKRAEGIIKVLFAISNAVNTTLNMKDLYRSIHYSLGRIIDVTNFFIAIVDSKERTLYFPYHVDTEDDDFCPITNFDHSHSLTGLVVSQHRPILLRKKELEDRASQNGVWGPVPLTWMGVPLIIKDEVIGVVAVQSYLDANLYSKQDLEVLSAVSDQMAIAIDRKRVEEALLESEERFRALFENAADAFFLTDMNGRILDVNQAACENLGYTREELLGLSIADVDAGNDQDKIESILGSFALNESKTIETVHKRKDQSKFPVEIRVRLFGKEQRPLVLSLARDITKRKEFEARLQQAHKMEAIGTLAGGIAHDFNNILYMITGNAELALEDIPAWNPAHANLKEIKAAGLRAAGIAKQLLNFSRKIEQELKPIGAITVIKDALKFLRSTIPTTIEIRANIPDTDVTIRADSIQINQVMMNLCINASQVMEETGGVLEVNVETYLTDDSTDRYSGLTAGEYIKITVSDTGPGIDPEIIDRIFDPYFTTKAVGMGSGMGLAVVHGIIINHDGAIFVDSRPGDGATFTIFFPVVSKKPVIEAKVTDQIPRGTGEKILFVDDEASIAKMNGEILERLGYSVETKTMPADALEMFQSQPHAFDLVVTDMTMPQMNGVQFSEKLKKIRPGIPVVICTGHSALIDEEKAKSIGIDGYVMKPVVIQDIAKTIRKILDEAKNTSSA